MLQEGGTFWAVSLLHFLLNTFDRTKAEIFQEGDVFVIWHIDDGLSIGSEV
jgi:hypothetical protein